MRKSQRKREKFNEKKIKKKRRIELKKIRENTLSRILLFGFSTDSLSLTHESNSSKPTK